MYRFSLDSSIGSARNGSSSSRLGLSFNRRSIVRGCTRCHYYFSDFRQVDEGHILPALPCDWTWIMRAAQKSRALSQHNGHGRQCGLSTHVLNFLTYASGLDIVPRLPYVIDLATSLPAFPAGTNVGGVGLDSYNRDPSG